MNLEKVISNMQELQSQIEVYEQKSKNINNAIVSIEKDIEKQQKKLSKETDELTKTFLTMKVIILKDVISKFNLDKEG